ncbi:P-type conjugative transfer protein TrbG [Rhodomicrobium vannielii ATCC 17100]|uniref:P-type conjugative transfer protein TrbG n=1 Tax=Rhodomicrobium vannielii (strain ATCC 17100 / DSM 162 / LMG 4299 / NCIMB 10020 / ATH 3.1.1) TaxID=648757 RepID=E3HZH0_RHOVT|nr:P-type conjugative transfer protein TrbG [Rhodomicrobium vannielii]ADP71005.1 P-type conjugative transfer protein TrbG [Rhodomicrobium vannielii ATCC 17100]
MRTVIVFVLSVLLSGAALAQAPQTIPDGPPPRVPLLSGPQPPLAPKEQKGLAYGKEWAGNRAGPARGDEGATVFVFGSTLPTIVCAPFYVCDLALQEGESVNDLNVGDSVRWKITPATQGAGEAIITHVIIKPTDVGLITNLVITTNRRTYIIKLVSRSQDWMPRVSFDYPDDASSQWKAYRTKVEQTREMRAAAVLPAPGKLDFEFAVSGDAPWKPTRVYTDGVKTYILFPPEVGSSELPALVEIAEDASILGLDSLFNGPTTRLVNYRFVEHRFEVDKVLTLARLTSGVGNSASSVTITRTRRD